MKKLLLLFLLSVATLNAITDKEVRNNLINKYEYVVAAKNVSSYTGWNWKKIYSWGHNESDFEDLVCYNVPEWRYGTLKVNHFSIDIGFCQLNSQNWEWTYKKALRLQREGLIRSDLVLYRPPIEWAKKQEALYKKIGPSKKKFKNYSFICSADCKESILLYRVLVEKARGKYDWNRNYEKQLLDLPQK